MFLVWCPSLLVFGLDLWLRICVATFRQLIASTHYRPSPPEIDLDYLHDKYNRPEVGTGEWIFEDDRYKAWRESRESKLLWLCGGPGTGKTTLAKRVAAEFLGELHNPPRRVKLIYYFVSPQLRIDGISAMPESSLAELAKIASDLLYGILQQDEMLFDGYRTELGKQGDRFFTNPYSLWKVLKEVIQACRANSDPLYLLIDGVDGLRESLCREFIERILLLGVKIFLSSRHVPHVSNNLSRHIKINLDTSSFVAEDVKTFIWKRVDALEGWDDDLKVRVKDAILAKAEGIFLWASLAIGGLAHFSSGPDFDKFLKNPPPRLEGIYGEMLGTLFSREEPGEVLNMIGSVALALRPLTFGELGHILACLEERTKTKQPGSEGASAEIRPRSAEEIKKYVQSALGFLRATATTVSIVHHTAIEYLFDENRKDGLWVLSKSEVHLTVSWECFRYLHHAFADPEELPKENVSGYDDKSYHSSSKRDDKVEELGGTPWEIARKDPQGAVAKWPCLKYASESWFIHARRTVEISKDKLCYDSTPNWLQHQFFETSDVIRKPWIELCGDPEMEVLAGEQTQLHIAVCLGIVPLVEKAFSDSTKENSNNQSPLHLAAKFMSGAYKILIAKSEPSHLTAPNQNSNTPLHEAAISGHWLMLAGLVKKFITPEYRGCSDEINKKNQQGNTPLHLALQFDHPGMVEFLSKNGADPSIKNSDRMTALELGAKLGRGESLDILKQAEKIRGKTKKRIKRETKRAWGTKKETKRKIKRETKEPGDEHNRSL